MTNFLLFIPYIYQCYLPTATTLSVGAVPRQRSVTVDIFHLSLADSCHFISTSRIHKGDVLLSYVKIIGKTNSY